MTESLWLLLLAFGKSFGFVFATLLPILNPAATAPIFLGLTEGASAATRASLARRIARNMVLLMTGAMLVEGRCFGRVHAWAPQGTGCVEGDLRAAGIRRGDRVAQPSRITDLSSRYPINVAPASVIACGSDASAVTKM